MTFSFFKSNVGTILIIDPQQYKQLSDAKQSTVHITDAAIFQLITDRNRELHADAFIQTH